MGEKSVDATRNAEAAAPPPFRLSTRRRYPTSRKTPSRYISRRCLFSLHSRVRSWLKFISDNCPPTLSLSLPPSHHFRAPRILNRRYWFNLHKLSGASERREEDTPPGNEESRSEISLKARKHETSEGKKEHIGQQQHPHPHPHFGRCGNWEWGRARVVKRISKRTQSLIATVSPRFNSRFLRRKRPTNVGHRVMIHTVCLTSAILGTEKIRKRGKISSRTTPLSSSAEFSGATD